MLIKFIALVGKSTLLITIIINVFISFSFLIFNRYKFNKKNNDILAIELNNKTSKLKNLFAAKFSPNKISDKYLTRDNLGVTGLSSWLYNNWDSFNDNQRKNYSLAVVKNADKMISFMNNILDFATLNKDDFYLKTEVMDLTALVLERADECFKLYQNHQNLIKFHYDLDPKVMIKGDIYLIRQAIDNLIISALNYNKGDIYIKLAVTQISDYHNNSKAVEFIIQDQKKRLKFNKAPYVANREINFTKDISLALCKKIIETHHGFIEVKDKQNDIKTGFKFLLPI